MNVSITITQAELDDMGLDEAAFKRAVVQTLDNGHDEQGGRLDFVGFLVDVKVVAGAEALQAMT